MAHYASEVSDILVNYRLPRIGGFNRSNVIHNFIVIRAIVYID